MYTYLSGKTLKRKSSELSSDRYEFITLDQAEPDFGLPNSNNSILSSESDGTRKFLTLASEFQVINNEITFDPGFITVNTDNISFSSSENLNDVFSDLDQYLTSNLEITLGDQTIGSYVETVVSGNGITITNAGGESSIPLIEHANTSSQSSLAALTGSEVISDVDLDEFGHVTNIQTRLLQLSDLGFDGDVSADSYGGWNLYVNDISRGLITSEEVVNITSGNNITVSYSSNNNTIEISAIDLASDPNDATITLSVGSGLSGGGDFTTDQATNETITFVHANTSSQSSVNNSNGSIIQDITLDEFGHVTGIGSHDLTPQDIGALPVDGTADNSIQLNGQNASYYLDWNNVINRPDPEITITLNGDVNGSASGILTNLSNVEIIISANIADDSHNHIISNIDGLQTELNGKADKTTTILAGSGLEGGGDLSSNRIISHTDTSTQNSVVNSDRTYIQSIELDEFGHITSIASKTETAAPGDNFVDAALFDTSNGILTLERTGTLSDINVDLDGRYVLVEGDTITGNLQIDGNLTVSGTTTFIESETLNIADNIVTLNSNYTGSNPTQNAGVEVERGTLVNSKLQWNELNNFWEIQSGGTTGRILTTGDEGPGNGLNADLLDNQQGSFYLDYNNFTNTPVIGDGVVTFNFGNGINGSGSFSLNDVTNTEITVEHANTSTQASVDNSNNNIIQDITLDQFGHVTGIGSTNLDNFYVNVTGDTMTGDLYISSNTTASNTSTGALTVEGGVGVDGDVYSSGDFVSLSDSRVKENIVLIRDPLSKIKQINGVYYNQKNKTRKEVGIIAQEVEKVLPEVVYDDENLKSVAYDRLIALLIEGMKEQQQRIEDLEEKLRNY